MSKRVIVKLMGGLGNQMFQYAYAKALAGNNTIIFNINSFKKRKHNHESKREYELKIFKSIKVKKINSLLLRFIISKTKCIQIFKKILSLKVYEVYSVNDNNMSFSVNLSSTNPIYLEGYFQNPIYFNSIRDVLVKEFRFPDLPNCFKETIHKIQSANSISIHVRRGDYLNSGNYEIHGVLPISYYSKAIEVINNYIQKPIYYVFSDDIIWCKANFNYLDYHINFISNINSDSWVDMYLMSLCKHNIIANSTYSWWSAWLNQNEDKIVVSPKKWFSTGKDNIIPEKWIRI